MRRVICDRCIARVNTFMRILQKILRWLRWLRAAGLHPVYLGQIFRQEFGETLGEYLNRIRLRATATGMLAGFSSSTQRRGSGPGFL